MSYATKLRLVSKNSSACTQVCRVYFSYEITMVNTSSLPKCISLYWGGSVKLFVFTYHGCQGLKCRYAIFSVKWFTSIRFNVVISFIYFNMELLRKDSIPFILWSWYHPWSACLYCGDVLIVCKHCECLGSSDIVSKTNSWISILHIFIHLKNQGCRFLTVYLWCDNHRNVGSTQMR
jgi:hypothetical protein